MMRRLFRWHGLLGNTRGNVLMVFAASLLPLTFATGMGIDYARAMKVQTKLNSVADAAALYAVSKPVMPLTDVQAQLYATTMFNAQASTLVTSGRVTITSFTVNAATDANGRRTATVSYTGTTPNAFGGILGMSTLRVSGVSTTTNATAPNIDFYMLLDVSGSMALPTTSAALNQLGGITGGCQFACHNTNDSKARDKNGNLTDYYGVAKSYGMTLRVDDEGTAVSKLTSDAQSTSNKNGANYRMAIYAFRGATKVAGDSGFTTLQTLTANLATASSKTTNLVPSLYYSNGCPTKACSSSDVGWNDQDTGSSSAFDKMNGLLPVPGTGLNGKAPQQVMFVITDGMRDENRPGGRPEIAFDTSKCTMIKAAGTRIAILYTEYLLDSMKNDSWSQTNVVPYMNQLEPALQACASPGLYTKVSTDQDIYTALDALFQNAVATARISR